MFAAKCYGGAAIAERVMYIVVRHSKSTKNSESDSSAVGYTVTANAWYGCGTAVYIWRRATVEVIT